jgi:citrate lyase subunit beta / citryl-CoA lyase
MTATRRRWPPPTPRSSTSRTRPLPTRRVAARAKLVAALGDLDPDRTIVRVNALDSDDGRRDVEALAGTPCRTVMVAKADDAAALTTLAAAGFAVIAIARPHAGPAGSTRWPRLPGSSGLMWGSEDLTADLGGRSSRGDDGRHLPHVTAVRAELLLATGSCGTRRHRRRVARPRGPRRARR